MINKAAATKAIVAAIHPICQLCVCSFIAGFLQRDKSRRSLSVPVNRYWF
jgi:hypothetical protein